MRINRIKFITELAKKDMTLKKLSATCGVSPQTLSYIKQGKGCSDKTGISIANALGVDVADILED